MRRRRKQEQERWGRVPAREEEEEAVGRDEYSFLKSNFISFTLHAIYSCVRSQSHSYPWGIHKEHFELLGRKGFSKYKVGFLIAPVS